MTDTGTSSSSTSSSSGDDDDDMRARTPAAAVALRPIRFQVSGHTPILHSVADPARSYKPYSAAEHAVYERLAHTPALAPLRAFAPRYYGVADVPVAAVGVDGAQPMLRFSRKAPADGAALAAAMTRAPTPAGVHAALARFVVLECVGCGLAHPCIADLKLGRAAEAHARTAACTPARRAWKTAKAARTTTAALACRVGGMLVWDPVARRHVFADKYAALDQVPLPPPPQGRSCGSSSDADGSSEEGGDDDANTRETRDCWAVLRASVRPLFADGAGGLRRGVLRACLERLRTLHAVVARVETCPFLLWSTSLLIVFDGDSGEEDAGVQVRLLDFGRVVPLDTAELRTLFGQDGVADGVANLAHVLASLLAE